MKAKAINIYHLVSIPALAYTIRGHFIWKIGAYNIIIPTNTLNFWHAHATDTCTYTVWHEYHLKNFHTTTCIAAIIFCSYNIRTYGGLLAVDEGKMKQSLKTDTSKVLPERNCWSSRIDSIHYSAWAWKWSKVGGVLSQSHTHVRLTCSMMYMHAGVSVRTLKVIGCRVDGTSVENGSQSIEKFVGYLLRDGENVPLN